MRTYARSKSCGGWQKRKGVRPEPRRMLWDDSKGVSSLVLIFGLIGTINWGSNPCIKVHWRVSRAGSVRLAVPLSAGIRCLRTPARSYLGRIIPCGVNHTEDRLSNDQFITYLQVNTCTHMRPLHCTWLGMPFGF